MFYEKILKPLLFRMDPEQAHERMSGLMSLAGKIPLAPKIISLALGGKIPGLETTVLGLRFENPIGLAAGFDKDCRMAPALSALGFGFLELGSITLKPQPGNPRPRIFRVPEAQALINRLGFNSEGALAAAKRLKSMGRLSLPLGINLGLNAECPKEEAPGQYAETFSLLAPYGDYFVVNVSSPNTAGLRALQERLHLEKILTALKERNLAAAPILVKIAPDQSEAQLKDLLDVIQNLASGIVVCNTTTTRPESVSSRNQALGGLSGAPLRDISTRLIGKVYQLTGGKLPIIGVGGIFSGRDAFEKIRAGASLVQLYTGLIYRGPAAARLIQGELSQLLREAGFKSVAQAVGTGALINA